MREDDPGENGTREEWRKEAERRFRERVASTAREAWVASFGSTDGETSIIYCIEVAELSERALAEFVETGKVKP